MTKELDELLKMTNEVLTKLKCETDLDITGTSNFLIKLKCKTDVWT